MKMLTGALAVLIALMLCTAACAEIVDSGTCGDKLTWTLDHHGVLTIDGTGTMWDSPAWNGRQESIRQVRIGPGVTSLGSEAFFSCKSLTEVHLSNVTAIGENAFAFCTALPSISLPNVTQLGEGAFAFCAALKQVTLNPWLTTIPYWCFGACEQLASIDLSHVTTLGSMAFTYCASLRQVILNPNLTAIPYWCFGDCVQLSSINLSRIIDLDYRAFGGCSALSEIILADGVALGAFAFADTASLKHVRFLGQAAPAQTTAFRNSNADCLFYYPDDAGWTYEQQFEISGREKNSQTGMAEGWIPYSRADYTVRALDAYTGKPIPNARITGPLIPPSITDADGCVTLRLWEGQLTDLVLSASGYEDVEIGSRLKKNASVEIRLRHPLPDLPSTGDDSTPLLWCALGAAGVLGALLLRRRGAGARRG